MQIVIDLPEEVYKRAKDGDLMNIHSMMICGAVADGTPLPQRHGRLIDADETISKICGSSCGCHLEECGHDKPCYSVTRIESAPTIIEADTEKDEEE